MLWVPGGGSAPPAPAFVDLHHASCAASDGHGPPCEEGGTSHCWIVALASVLSQVGGVTASEGYEVIRFPRWGPLATAEDAPAILGGRKRLNGAAAADLHADYASQPWPLWRVAGRSGRPGGQRGRPAGDGGEPSGVG